MPTDYSSVILHIPTGYFSRHLGQMALATAKFRGMRISQGASTIVRVTGEPESSALQEVLDWAKKNLPDAFSDSTGSTEVSPVAEIRPEPPRVAAC